MRRIPGTIMDQDGSELPKRTPADAVPEWAGARTVDTAGMDQGGTVPGRASSGYWRGIKGYTGPTAAEVRAVTAAIEQKFRHGFRFPPTAVALAAIAALERVRRAP